jgi:hypothetical protein
MGPEIPLLWVVKVGLEKSREPEITRDSKDSKQLSSGDNIEFQL